jgi:hypothetical protein
MKSFRKIFSDPALYLLIILNVYFIYEYKDEPGKYTTIIWIFWMQSVLIGLFNFFELITTKNLETKGFKVNDKEVDSVKARGCYSWFFLVHYQFFHLGYFIFLAVDTNWKYIDLVFLKYAFLALLVNQTVVFIRHKQSYSQHAPNLGFMFFLPYLRIIPMHMMILLPAFLGWEPSVVFLVLKAVFDIIGHLITTRWYWKTGAVKPLEVN